VRKHLIASDIIRMSWMGWRFPEIGHPHSAEAGVLLVFPIQYWKNHAATLADLINRGLPENWV